MKVYYVSTINQKLKAFDGDIIPFRGSCSDFSNRNLLKINEDHEAILTPFKKSKVDTFIFGTLQGSETIHISWIGNLL